MIVTNKSTERLSAALRTLGDNTMRDDSSYPLSRAQRALSGRTHYVDDATLKCFKARVLRCTVAHHGFYCLLQESLPMGNFNGPRMRRNVLFDAFGSVVEGSRGTWHKSAKSADAAYSELCAWMDSQEATDKLTAKLRERIKADQARQRAALSALGGRAK